MQYIENSDGIPRTREPNRNMHIINLQVVIQSMDISKLQLTLNESNFIQRKINSFLGN